MSWRSLTQYHPRIGYTFIPGVKARVSHEAGGYLVRANQAGFRCAHEVERGRPSGQRRALVFGDSQTAGDGVSNGDRYSDWLERHIPELQVLNFGLPGTGTDQQYLAWQDFARDVDHDLLVLGVHVENIGRVNAGFRPYIDENGNEVIYAKPYFTLDGDVLSLHHVPVPKAPVPKDQASAHLDTGLPFHNLRKVAKLLGVRDMLAKWTHFQPVPDYDDASGPKWRLMRRILEQWIRESPVRVLLVPIPLFSFVEGFSDPSSYQARFRELAGDAGCTLHDPLPDLMSYSEKDRRSFRFATDVHFTPAGHRALAESLAPVVRRLL